MTSPTPRDTLSMVSPPSPSLAKAAEKNSLRRIDRVQQVQKRKPGDLAATPQRAKISRPGGALLELERSRKRLEKQYPEINPDLCQHIFAIQAIKCDALAEADIQAIVEMQKLLEADEGGEQLTEAMVRSCVHSELVKALRLHGQQNLSLALEALTVLNMISSDDRLDHKEQVVLRNSMVSLGVLDCAMSAMESFPKSPDLAIVVSTLASNIMEAFTFEDLCELGFVEIAVSIMRRLPEHPKVLLVCCDMLFWIGRRSTDTSCRSNLYDLKCLSILSGIMEGPGRKHRELMIKAKHALASILQVKLPDNEDSAGISSDAGESDKDG